MKKGFRILVGAVIAAVFIVLAILLIRSGHYDVLQPHGNIAVQQRNLLYATLILSAIVILPVFGMLGLFAWKYREGRGERAARYTPEWSTSTPLEIIWWGIPILIIGILAIITWQTSHSLDPARKINPNAKSLEVQVVALQWKWLFIYPELGIASVNQLPVPVGTPIHFTLTADAPMSAFWVPALGTQIYAMSGMSSQLNLIADTVGDFPGYTTNINGTGYADMKFVVHSWDKQKFDTWAKAATKSPRVLDGVEYARLAAPSKINEERTYVLRQPDLYNTVIMKYMGTAPDGGTPSSIDNTHSMTTMKGM